MAEHDRAEVVAELQAAEVATVATASGRQVRARMMHFASDEDFNIYLASIKGDPKTLQILRNPSVSLLVLRPAPDMNDSKEIEVIGRAETLKDEKEREAAFALIAQKSPVVKYFREINNTGVLEAVKVVPETVKYRIFREIVQGQPPTVFQGVKQGEESEYRQLWEKVRNWVTAIRVPFLTASLVPILLGSVMAWAREGVFSWPFFLAALVAGLCLQAGTNIANDYYDHKSGNDEINKDFVRPFSGGSRVIQLGLLSPMEVLGLALFFFVAGSAIGLYLAWAVGPSLLLLGVIGVVSGFFYTAPPFRWAHRGVGELLVGLNFGVLMTLGAYYVQARSWSLEVFLASLPVALLIAAVLYINQFPDYTADKAVGKDHWVVRLGLRRAVWGYALLMGLTYAIVVGGVAGGILSPYALLGLFTLPLAARAVAIARKSYAQPLDLAPANALTILTHLILGILVVMGYTYLKLGKGGLLQLGALLALSLGLVSFYYINVERRRRALAGLKERMKA